MKCPKDSAGFCCSNAKELVRTISLESGKTLRDARIESKRARRAVLLSTEEAKRINGEVVPVDAVAGTAKGVAMVLREPLGLKDGGIGLEGIRYAVEAMTRLKTAVT